MRDDDGDETQRPRRRVGRGRSLLVTAEDLFTTHPLPDVGEVMLGRSPSNTVRIDHRSVSRRHAVLRVGEGLEIEDLGSANGTRVRGEPLTAGRRAHVELGDAIELGEVVLVVRAAAAPGRLRRVWPHGYFEGHVEDECARAARSGQTFAVLRLNVPRAPAGLVEDAFTSQLRPLDVLALYAPGEYEVLLLEITPDEAEAISRRLAAHLEAAGARVRMGLACYLRDGTTPEALIGHACAAVQGVVQLRPNEATPPTAMGRLKRLAEQVAASELSVLILGETGVGKEVMAETLHSLSPRKQGHFLRLHCAALSESLLESELFGHERGAFTGALAAKAGLLETAPGGTIFLDEVGELPVSTQVKLLRVLEDRRVMRVGGLKARDIDVRFIAATNRDLETEISLGRFRQDLYFRLNGVSLTIPPLRERVDEIEPLARTFVAEACQQSRRAAAAISDEAMELLRRYSWPGNIRELRNAMERAVVLCGAGPIRVEHLPVDKMGATVLGAGAAPAGTSEFDESANTGRVPRLSEASLRENVDAFERQRIVEALARCAGNQTQAARLLGISRGSLVARLDAYGIPRPRKGPAGG